MSGIDPFEEYGWIEVNPVFDNKVIALCLRSYPRHKNGCPNYGNKDICPPNAPILKRYIDPDQEVYAIFNRFEFGEHVDRMYKLHPTWSKRQAECCLYWQGTARKQHVNN